LVEIVQAHRALARMLKGQVVRLEQVARQMIESLLRGPQDSHRILPGRGTTRCSLAVKRILASIGAHPLVGERLPRDRTDGKGAREDEARTKPPRPHSVDSRLRYPWRLDPSDVGPSPLRRDRSPLLTDAARGPALRRPDPRRARRCANSPRRWRGR